MVSNCINCGSPIEKGKEKCPYCGTTYDASGFSSKINKSIGEITIDGKSYKVYLADFETKKIFREACRDKNGNMVLNNNDSFKRIFKLIEV